MKIYSTKNNFQEKLPGYRQVFLRRLFEGVTTACARLLHTLLNDPSNNKPHPQPSLQPQGHDGLHEQLDRRRRAATAAGPPHHRVRHGPQLVLEEPIGGPDEPVAHEHPGRPLLRGLAGGILQKRDGVWLPVPQGDQGDDAGVRAPASKSRRNLANRNVYDHGVCCLGGHHGVSTWKL